MALLVENGTGWHFGIVWRLIFGTEAFGGFLAFLGFKVQRNTQYFFKNIFCLRKSVDQFGQILLLLLRIAQLSKSQLSKSQQWHCLFLEQIKRKIFFSFTSNSMKEKNVI